MASLTSTHHMSVAASSPVVTTKNASRCCNDLWEVKSSPKLKTTGLGKGHSDRYSTETQKLIITFEGPEPEPGKMPVVAGMGRESRPRGEWGTGNGMEKECILILTIAALQPGMGRHAV